jgi:hypothetical protein
MGDFFDRRPVLAGSGVIAAILIVMSGLLVFAGGQTSKILSTVGSSVGGPVAEGPQETQPQPAAGEATPPAATAPPAGKDALAPAPALLIVRTGTLRLEVGKVDELLDRVASIVTSAGGYVAASKTNANGAGAGGASVDLRIPSASWDSTLSSLRGLGTVRDQQIGTEEVTGQVIDLDARVRNLRATEAALQAVMAKATRIQDILDVQQQLTETRGQIEELTAKAASLRDRASFGSLTVVLSTPAPAPTPTATPKPPPGWDPGRDAAAATAKLVRIGQGATTAGIWFAIVGIPLLVALAVGLGVLRVGWLLLRRTGLVGEREPI